MLNANDRINHFECVGHISGLTAQGLRLIHSVWREIRPMEHISVGAHSNPMWHYLTRGSNRIDQPTTLSNFSNAFPFR